MVNALAVAPLPAHWERGEGVRVRADAHRLYPDFVLEVVSALDLRPPLLRPALGKLAHEGFIELIKCSVISVASSCWKGCSMATFVLVHGSMHGGWCRQRVTPRLRAAGHEVHTPTLSGLGDRAHEAPPAIDLETHIADVLAVLGPADTAPVILVGHSYATMVVTGAADHAPGRVAHLVYLDGPIPTDGDALLDFFPPEGRAARYADVEN